MAIRSLPLLLVACASAPPAADPDPSGGPAGPITFVSGVLELAPSDLGQHHATFAFGADGSALAAFSHGTWVTAATLPDGVRPGGTVPVSYPYSANHPQVAAWSGGYLVATTATGLGLGTSARDLRGEPVGETELIELEDGAIPLFPDLSLVGDDGLLAWTDGTQLHGRRFTGPFLDGVDLAPSPAATPGATVGTLTVRPGDDGHRLVWSEVADGIVAVHTARVAEDTLVGEDLLTVAELPVTDPDARPALAVGPSGWAVGWRADHDRMNAARAWLRLYDADDVPILDVTLHERAPARRPSLAADGDLLVAAWEQVEDGLPEVWLGAWSLADGAVVAAPIRASVPDGRQHNRPYVTLRHDGEQVRGLVGWEALEGFEAGESIHRSVLVRAFTVESE